MGATNFTLREDVSALLFAVGSSCNVSVIYFQRLHLPLTFHIDVQYNINMFGGGVLRMGQDLLCVLNISD